MSQASQTASKDIKAVLKIGTRGTMTTEDTG